ncbi:MAG: transcription antitermination factor NusB [Bifidobacteriaceae bacterium]|jgi:N utilization substance protein B|nr:transcription antitermination factor NusB [Bifidobacteriaceae bacterium]
MARSTARKRALNTLYEADEKGQDILSLLSERIANPGAQTPLPDYAQDIVRGVAAHRFHIDELLDAHSETWKVRRMPVVDRNILRIGTWEIVYNDEIPPRVAIDEALQLTKKLSDYDAPAFVHGVLSAIADDPEAKPEETPEATPEETGESSEEDEKAESVEQDSVETAEVPAVPSDEADDTSEAAPESDSGQAADSGVSEASSEAAHATDADADGPNLADINLSDFAE